LAEWQVEEGIGEHRAVLMDGKRVVAAKLDWPGALAAGAIAEAVLVARAAGDARGRARFDSGEEALVDHLPASASEGARLRLQVTRAALGEAQRRKLARARPTEAPCRPAPTLRERLGARRVHALDRQVWAQLRQDAWTGQIAFAGGSLEISPTPAMTLIDVDGTLPARSLALAAATQAARAIRLLDLSGSVGIDFPTLTQKADRKAVDLALGEALAGFDHERTAMNGFGFVQVVSRFEAPSLLHRMQFDRVGASARWLLWLAEGHRGPGRLLLTAAPPVIAALRPEWLAELARRTACEVALDPQPHLALGAPHAQVLAR
jgi:ribonuclease G